MLKPFFPFYGSKWRIAKLYPAPAYAGVVEPFAGSAGYSTYWEPAEVELADHDPIIVGVWHYLIHASEADVLALPDLQAGERVHDLSVCQEAKWLIGFWINRGSACPKDTMTGYSTRTEKKQLIWSRKARERIASQQPRIRHWNVTQMFWADWPVLETTWFIDPPYVLKGRYYRVKTVDHAAIGRWAQQLSGQVIVCEHPSATWLPFQPLTNAKSTKGFAQEAVYIHEQGKS